MKEEGFESFWKAWPANSERYSRKGAKAKCKQVWIKNHNATQAGQILKHVEWLKTTGAWLKDGGAFIPAPLVYLNQQRWDGAEIPEIAAPVEKTREYLAKHEQYTAQTPDHRAALLAARQRIVSKQ